MKRIIKYIIPLSVMTFAASCGSDAVLDEMNDDEFVEVNFTPSSAVQSRFDDDGFDNGDRVFIYRIQDNGNFGERKEFKYSNGNLLPVTDTFKKKKNESVEFLALTPGFTESSEGLVYNGGTTDYLGAAAEATSSTVELPFVHLHGQIRVRVLNNSYSVRSVQLLNVYNKELIHYDSSESALMYTCHGNAATVTMSTDSNTSTYPYYYYIPQANYLPQMQLKVTYTNGASTTFNFKSNLGYINSNYIYYFDVDMSSRSNIAARSGDEVSGLECVKTEPIN